MVCIVVVVGGGGIRCIYMVKWLYGVAVVSIHIHTHIYTHVCMCMWMGAHVHLCVFLVLYNTLYNVCVKAYVYMLHTAYVFLRYVPV